MQGNGEGWDEEAIDSSTSSSVEFSQSTTPLQLNTSPISPLIIPFLVSAPRLLLLDLCSGSVWRVDFGAAKQQVFWHAIADGRSASTATTNAT